MAHYILDLFTNPVTSAPIVDVLEPANGQSLTNGTFVVRVPDLVPISTPLPSTLGALMTKKYAGLLSFYTGFTNVIYDDLLDASGIDLGVTQGHFGARGSISLAAGATMQSVATPLGSTPSAALLTWEVFTYVDADPKADRFTRTYNELATISANTTAHVSFDGGLNFSSTVDSGVLSIPGAIQGSSLVVRLTNNTASRLYVGSWALIY